MKGPTEAEQTPSFFPPVFHTKYNMNKVSPVQLYVTRT